MIKRKITAVSALGLVLMMAACSGGRDVQPSESGSTGSEIQEESVTANDTEEGTSEEDSSSEAVLTGWEDMEYEFFGDAYALPFSADTLSANGWSISGITDEYSAEHVLKKGEKVSNVYSLSKDGYDSNVRILVGFVNNGSSSAKITDCDVWSFVCNIYDENNKVLYENVPELKLANGITWGSTSEEVEAAYGEPVSVMESQEEVDDYKVYTYMYNGLDIMKLTVRADYGLVEAVLLSYNEE